MLIAIREDLPLIRTRLTDLLSHHPHRDKIRIESVSPFPHTAPQDPIPHLLLWEGAVYSPRVSAPSRLTVIPFAVPLAAPPEGEVLFAGMEIEAAISFSSIGERDALLCISREFSFAGESILPFEKKVPYDRNYTLYKNLAAGFALALADLYFGEEP